MKCEPVQLIKSSPGKACRVTPHLTVGFSERSDCLSWPSESELVATQDSFPQRLLTVELTGKLGAEEREALHRLKQRAESEKKERRRGSKRETPPTTADGATHDRTRRSPIR